MQRNLQRNIYLSCRSSLLWVLLDLPIFVIYIQIRVEAALAFLFFCLSSFSVPRGAFNRPRRKPITSDGFVTPVALCRRINNPATLTTCTYTSRPVCRHSKHFGRIICSTRFDTRVSVVSYLRSNVAPSTRARDAGTNKKGKKAAAWRRNTVHCRRLEAIRPSLLTFLAKERDLF